MVLAIDYGRKRVGLAISDETETFAFVLDPITITKNTYLIAELKKICEVNSVNKVIIGLPLGISGNDTQMSLEVKRFAEKLKNTLELNYEFWNETATSEISKGIVRKKKGGSIDSHSAQIILQEYLDYLHNKI